MKLTKLLATAALAAGLGTAALAEDKTKVGFVYVGPIGDGGAHSSPATGAPSHGATLPFCSDGCTCRAHM